MPAAVLPRVVVAKDGGASCSGNAASLSSAGMNYGNHGRLMEDFWNEDWETLARDFRELRALGANVVRVHLQFGRFMKSAEEPNRGALEQYRRLLGLAEQARTLRLDVTGLACYRPADVPAWYDDLDEGARWAAQEKFWSAVAEAGKESSVIFCYDLINEPLSPGEKRAPSQWRSGSLLGGYDFLQFIALDPAGRKREDIAVEWIRRMSAGIRRSDRRTLITVGLLPWSRQWHHLSGFLPEKIAPGLDFLSVHIYRTPSKLDEALEPGAFHGGQAGGNRGDLSAELQCVGIGGFPAAFPGVGVWLDRKLRWRVTDGDRCPRARRKTHAGKGALPRLDASL